ncbi:MAG: methyltransferase domain-containing protein [Rhodospirillales bacterium]|nr:methyltransferase domain-containing protein [Rhodospirillales bacterium]
MPPHPSQPNPDLLSRIPLSARAVVEIGCGTGALAAAHRAVNPRVRWYGVDSDPAAIEEAARWMDGAACLDIETDPLPFDLPEGIDCLIYGDALQRLRDPSAVLRRHVAQLQDEGMLLICVPNLEHWSFAERLLRGTWAYEPAGLLDRTHLRWFTLDTLRQDLLEMGLSICDVHPRIFAPEAAQRFTAAIAPALAALGVDQERYLQRAMPLQYVWRVRKTPRQRLIVGGNMLDPVGGVSHVRVVHPLAALGTDPTVTARVATALEETPVGDTTPRIFVLHRPALTGERGTALLQALISNNWLVVTEFDDLPDHFAPLRDPAHLTFRGVHAIQTSTPALAAVLRTRNPEVAVFPNALTTLPEPRNFADFGRLTLFFGALNREADWQPLMPVLNEVARSVGERLRFEVVHDRLFFDALETPHKRFTPTCDYETYMALLGGSEISFMPLGDTAFNRAKSDLKFIEAGGCRVVALASPIVYADSVVDGETGLLFRDPGELRDRLQRLLALPERALAIAEAARRYVAENRMMAYQVADRIAWYRSLWARRDELSRAIARRLGSVPPA